METMYKSWQDLKKLADEHWQKYQPTYYNYLKSKGTLDETLTEVAKWTFKEMESHADKMMKVYNVGRPMAEASAREVYLPMLILLPDEKENTEEREDTNYKFVNDMIYQINEIYQQKT